MPQSFTDNRRVLKNVGVLYVRMGITVLINLYIARVVLEALGQEDFGLYSVVGGIVTILSFINGSMSNATQRFLNFEIGAGADDKLRDVFKSSRQIHSGLALLVILLAETIGLWFLNAQMNFPVAKSTDANWVYQFSILACCFTVINVPYTGLLMARENMSFFAVITLTEVFLKLLIALFILYGIGEDRLIIYAALMAAVQLVSYIIARAYCRKRYFECRTTNKGFNRPLIKSMTSFAGWSVLGTLTYVGNNQGMAIVVNIFFGVIVNAAMGITNQVSGIVTAFTNNFLVAFCPQVVKNYAANNLEEVRKQLFMGCKIAIFLVSIMLLPIYFMLPLLLDIWLTEIPPYTEVFIKIALLICICNSFSSLLVATQGATGDIKKYQIVLTLISLVQLPVIIFLFYLKLSPVYAMIVAFMVAVVMQLGRIYFVGKVTRVSIFYFTKMVLVPAGICLLISFVIPGIYQKIFIGDASFSQISSAIFSCVILIVSSAYIMFNRAERAAVIVKLKGIKHRLL